MKKEGGLKNFKIILALLIITYLAFMIPANALSFTIGFPHTVKQLGQDGDMGIGGGGGGGGKGGAGAYSLDDFWISLVPAKPGVKGSKGGTGGAGGKAGDGEWIIQSVDPGDAVKNFGDIQVGGPMGATGAPGKDGAAGGKGGTGGKAYYGGQAGQEPSPDSWPGTIQGGAGGATAAIYGKTGKTGSLGGGGGGGGGAVPIPWGYGGSGGAGGTGANGGKGTGGSGQDGNSETAQLSSSFINSTTLQIGGHGGHGGQGGQGGSGGGGGGGRGAGGTVGIPDNYSLSNGAIGGARGAGGDGGIGGVGGKGTIDIRRGGRLINENHIQMGGGSNGQGEGYIKVRPGGELTNNKFIGISAKGKLEVLGGKVSNTYGGILSISPGGTIENNGVIVNNGVLANSWGQVKPKEDGFFNYGVFKGTGLYEGDFTNYGIVAPGDSIGEMRISGIFDNEHTLEIEIGGFDSGMHDFLKISDPLEPFGTASFSEHSMINFLSWNDYDFSDIMPKQSKTLEFLSALGGFSDFYPTISFGDGFLPDGFGYNVYIDDQGMFLEVSNNPVPAPATLILLGSGLVGLIGLGRKRFKK